MKKASAIFVALVIVGGAGIAAATQWPSAPRERQSGLISDLQIASFTVENMTCATCPITVRRAMEGVTGVQDVKIDFAAKRATAHFDPARASINAIAAASTSAGYPAREIGE